MNETYVGKARALLRSTLPGLEKELLDLYTLLVLVKGEGTTLEDVHDAWAVWRSRTDPYHRSIIPFGELSWEVQELDRKYMKKIHETARMLGPDEGENHGA